MVIIINEMNTRGVQEEHSFAEIYSLEAGIKKFGDKGYKAVYEEIKQLHDRICFNPISITTMTQKEKNRTLESLIFLKEMEKSSPGCVLMGANREHGWERKTHQVLLHTWRASC